MLGDAADFSGMMPCHPPNRAMTPLACIRGRHSPEGEPYTAAANPAPVPHAEIRECGFWRLNHAFRMPASH